MELEIQKVITDNLPEQVGKVLRHKLEQADKDKIDLELYQEEIQRNHLTIKGLEKEVSDLRQRINAEMDLERMAADIKERERGLTIEILKVRLEESDKRNSIGQHLVEQVFRSPVYRKHIENAHVSYYDNQKGTVVVGAVPTHITESND